MITNYSITAARDTIKTKFFLDQVEDFTPVFNAQPTQSLPVITSNQPDQSVNYHWGIVGDFTRNKSVSDKLLYAPFADIPNKASLRDSFLNKRCVIISDGFYTWKAISKKGLTPYRFFLPNNECFAMAGLWSEYNTDEDKVYPTFKIITTEPTGITASYAERVPIILNEDFLIEWLNPSTKDDSLLAFLKNDDMSKMMSNPVNPRLKDPSFNSEELWQEAPPADQFGNLTLFS